VNRNVLVNFESISAVNGTDIVRQLIQRSGCPESSLADQWGV